MKLKTELRVLCIMLLAIAVFDWLLPLSDSYLLWYNKLWFIQYQCVRGWLFNWCPLSIGDLLYFFAGAFLLYSLVKWLLLFRHFKAHSRLIVRKLLRLVSSIAAVYLLFLVSWGVNYDRKPLALQWQLTAGDTLRIRLYDSLLVERLNLLSGQYRSLDVDAAGLLAGKYYGLHTDAAIKVPGLFIKKSLYSWMLDRLAIEGYYNPFTGEGQVSRGLPRCMVPFVICHEMAHQAGIAAEGDANLFAYSLCMLSGDPTFQYSASLNVWLYADRRLKWKDTAAARTLSLRLNTLSKAHLDSLEKMTELYDNDMSVYSSELYDKYLKMQRQHEGVRSYGNLLYNAWLWDKEYKNNNGNRLVFPAQ